MKIAFIVFKDITWLDMVGVYDPITRLKALNYLPALTWDFCSFTQEVTDSHGLSIGPLIVQPDLTTYNAIFIPGGKGTRVLLQNHEFINWIHTAEGVPQKISVCTGSLILGAAGFLKNIKATTHFDEYETLRPYCKEVSHERIVEDGDCITAGAVSSSLDLGLYLCEKWAGKEAATFIRKKMEYNG